MFPKPTYQNPGERRKTKRKQEKRVLWPWKIERVGLLLFFFHWVETPVDGEYETEKYGVLQVDNVDLHVLGLFTSRTDKACLGDLLNSKCFIGKAEELVEGFLSRPK